MPQTDRRALTTALTSMHVLVTGGAGFIGSHAALRLLEEGHDVTVVDSLVRGHRGAIAVLDDVARPLRRRVRFEELDLAEDRTRLRDVLVGARPDLVMHFAALAYVGESVGEPLRYWRAGAMCTLALLEAMDAAGAARLVFSSTCATYGEPAPDRIPISEDCPQAPTNPYGRSKLACEQMIRDHAVARRRRGDAFAWACLRYFNVAGCDPRGRLGEDHRPETHLIPICLQVALGQRAEVTVFGADYATPDGTCVRDYVHVDDLVDAHVLAANALGDADLCLNVGTGRGHSVREVIEACRRVTGHPIPERTGPRRAGDPASLVASPDRIRALFGWTARRPELSAMVDDAWRWMRDHPAGYDD